MADHITKRRRKKETAFAAATLQLADQLRRDLPGQQTANRLEQSQHFRGVIYIAIRALMDAMYSSSIQLNRKHRRYHETSLRREERAHESAYFKALECLDRDFDSRFDSARSLDGFVATRTDYNSELERLNSVFKALPTPHANTEDERFRPFDEPGHSLVKLIDRPNRTETFNELLAQLVMQYQLTGMGLLWANPNALDVPGELYVLPTALCYAQPASPDFPEGWWRVTQYYPSGGFGMIPSAIIGGGAPVDGRDIFQFKNPHPLWRWDAYSPLTACATQLDVLESIDIARWTAMDMGLTPDMVLLAPGVNQKQLDVYLERLKETNIGKRNHRKVMAIGGDQYESKFDVKFPNTSAKDMDFGAGWDQMVAFALAAFGVPKSVASLATTGSYAELYAALKQFHTLTLRPLVARLGAWLTRHLARIWGDDFAIQLDLPTIDDQQLQEQQLSTDLAHDGITFNEYRAVRGRKPMPGGDVLVSVFVQQQQAKAAQEQQAQNPQPQQPPQPGDPNAAPQPGAPSDQAAAAQPSLPNAPQAGASPQPEQQPQGDQLSQLLGTPEPGGDDQHVQNSVAEAALGALGVPPGTTGTVEKSYEPFYQKARKFAAVGASPSQPPGKRASGPGGSAPTPAAPIKVKTPPTEERGDAPGPSDTNTKAGGTHHEEGSVWPAPQTGAARQTTAAAPSAPAPAPQPAPNPSAPPKPTAAQPGQAVSRSAIDERAAAVLSAPVPAPSGPVPTPTKPGGPGNKAPVTGTLIPRAEPAPITATPVATPIPHEHRREGEVFQGPTGHWYKIQNKQPVPTYAPNQLHPQQVTQAILAHPAYAKLNPAQLITQHQKLAAMSDEAKLALAKSLMVVHPDAASRLSVPQIAARLGQLGVPNAARMPHDTLMKVAFDAGLIPEGTKLPESAPPLAPTPKPAAQQPSLPNATAPVIKPIAPKEQIAALAHADQLPPPEQFAEAAQSVTAPTPAAQTVLANANQWASSLAERHADTVAKHFGVSREQAVKLLMHAITSVAQHAAQKAVQGGTFVQPVTGTMRNAVPGHDLTVKLNPRSHAAIRLVNDIADHIATGGELSSRHASEAVGALAHLTPEEQKRIANDMTSRMSFSDGKTLNKLIAHAEKNAPALEKENPATPQAIPKDNSGSRAFDPAKPDEGGLFHLGSEKERAVTGKGTWDEQATATSGVMDRARELVTDHLAKGGRVTMWTEGKAVPIVKMTNGMMEDNKGQRWGMLPLLSAAPGTSEGLQFHPVAAAPALPLPNGTAGASTAARASRAAAAGIAGVMSAGQEALGQSFTPPSPEHAQPAMVQHAPERPAPGAELLPPGAPAQRPTFGAPIHNPDVSEVDEHGITKASRVGVLPHEIPDTIHTLPKLAARERRAETKFREKYQENPDRVAGQFLDLVNRTAKQKGDVPTFGTDDAKELSAHWTNSKLSPEDRSRNRATLNLALHQTANAIAKRAFVKHLDTLKPGDKVLVTVGGVGAGKGYAISGKDKAGNPLVPQAAALKKTAKAIWDSAGDQNATENPWIQKELEKRGLKGVYMYVHADPKTQWSHPERGVVKRAGDPNDGRMVDAHVFADSYALGAKNHQAFAKANEGNPNAEFMYLQNGSPPKLLPGMPSEALNVDRNDLLRHALKTLHESDAPEHVKHGGALGSRIWGAPGTMPELGAADTGPRAAVADAIKASSALSGREGHRAQSSLAQPQPYTTGTDLTQRPPTSQEIENGELGAHLHPGVQIRHINGKDWVIKGRANSARAARNEQVASSLAQIAGLNIPQAHHVTVHGQDAIAVERVHGTPLVKMDDAQRREALGKVPKSEIDKHALFDYLIGSSDPNHGNYLVTPEGKFTAIDKEKSLSHGAIGHGTLFHAPYFLADVPTVPAGRFEFQPEVIAHMAASGSEMAQHLRKLGHSADARGVERRTAVLNNLAKSGKPVSLVALKEAGAAYNKSSPLSFSERLKSFFGR